MPVVLRRVLGFIILVATVGLATCQSMVRAEPVVSAIFADNANQNARDTQ
ncbi:MAG: hypothetical protein ACU83N_02590 [Gammaproteobacteria bacterium]